MPWVRLDEQFPDHPKVQVVGPLASWLHVCALAYCNRLLTDGFVPKNKVATLGDFSGVWDQPDGAAAEFSVDPYDLAAKLCDAGMWERVQGGYRIHDYHDYQPSRADEHEKRRQKAEAGAKGGRASGETRRRSGPVSEANTKQNRSRTEAEPKQTGSTRGSVSVEAKPNPDPTRTDNYQSQKRVRSSAENHMALVPDLPSPTAPDAFEAFWGVYPPRDGKRIGKAKAAAYWRKLTTAERAAAMVGAQHHAAALAAGGKFGPPDADRWLRDRKWLDWQEPADVAPATPARIDPYATIGAAARVLAERNEAVLRGEACGACGGVGWTEGDGGVVACLCRTHREGRVSARQSPLAGQGHSKRAFVVSPHAANGYGPENGACELVNPATEGATK